MDRQQKLAIGAVVAIVALFSGSVALGGGAGDGGFEDTRSGVVTWLGDIFGDPPPVAPADVSAACLAGTRFTVDGACQVRVASGDEDQRSLKLRATNAVRISAPAPRSDSTVESTVEAGDEATVAVDADGADVTIACAGEDACVVDLVTEE